MENLKGQVFNIQKFSIHDGPGIRTTVFLKGCPLSCLWCSNPESQKLEPQQMEGKADSREYTVSEVVEICLQDKDFYEESGGGVTISGGEPFIQHEFLKALLKSLMDNKISTAIETTGFVDSIVLEKTIPYVDLVIMDIKHHNREKHKEGTGVSNDSILKNFKLLVDKGQDLLVRIPVIPKYNDDLVDAETFAEILNSTSVNKVQLLPFHQMGENKYKILKKEYELKNMKALYPEDLEDYKNVFLSKGIDAFF